MAKRKKAKVRDVKRSETAKQTEMTGEKTFSAEEDKDNRTDYGGLPLRDLKKNLGCG